MKTQRQDLILEIIRTCSPQTQEKLRDILKERGVKVTQATLSRDIKELGLIKKRGGYSIPERWAADIPALIKESVRSVDFALNTVVFKCRAGMAMAACAVFDGLGYSGVVGTLAGDDTIFMVMRSEKDAAAFVKEMRSVIFNGNSGDSNAE